MAETIKKSELEALFAQVAQLTALVSGQAQTAQAQAAPVVTAQQITLPVTGSNYDKLPNKAQIVVNGKVVADLTKKMFNTGNYGYYAPSFNIGDVAMQACNIFVHKNSK